MEEKKKEIDIKWLQDLENYFLNQISWNLNMQLAWIGVVLGSGIGLFEIYGNDFNTISIASLSFFGLIIIMILSIHQVASSVQKIVSKTIILTDVRRNLYNKNIGRFNWSWKQKLLLDFTEDQPRLRMRRMYLIYSLIILYSLLLFLEKQQLFNFV